MEVVDTYNIAAKREGRPPIITIFEVRVSLPGLPPRCVLVLMILERRESGPSLEILLQATDHAQLNRGRHAAVDGQDPVLFSHDEPLNS